MLTKKIYTWLEQNPIYLYLLTIDSILGGLGIYYYREHDLESALYVGIGTAFLTSIGVVGNKLINESYLDDIVSKNDVQSSDRKRSKF